MGFKGFDIPEKKYKEEIQRLSKIAQSVWNSDRGHFERKLADAWLHADSSNQRILREAWSAMVIKYDLIIENDPERARFNGCVDFR